MSSIRFGSVPSNSFFFFFFFKYPWHSARKVLEILPTIKRSSSKNTCRLSLVRATLDLSSIHRSLELQKQPSTPLENFLRNARSFNPRTDTSLAHAVFSWSNVSPAQYARNCDTCMFRRTCSSTVPQWRDCQRKRKCHWVKRTRGGLSSNWEASQSCLSKQHSTYEFIFN